LAPRQQGGELCDNLVKIMFWGLIMIFGSANGVRGRLNACQSENWLTRWGCNLNGGRDVSVDWKMASWQAWCEGTRAQTTLKSAESIRLAGKTESNNRISISEQNGHKKWCRKQRILKHKHRVILQKKTLPKHTDQLTGSHEIDRHRHEFTNTNKLIDFLSYSGAKSSWNTNWSWIFERIRVSVIQNGQNLDWIVRITEYPNTDTHKNIPKSAKNWSRLRQFEWRT